MEDLLLMDAAERFLNGEMSEQEELYFQELRKTNQELDQWVVEQSFFYNQLSSYSKTKRFKTLLTEVQDDLHAKGEIPLSKSQGKLIYLWNRYKRTIAVAASIAGIVSLSIASVISAINNQKSSNITPLVKKINEQENKTRAIESKLNQLQAETSIQTKIPKVPFVDAKFSATGFMIDVANKYLVTNAHVVSRVKNQLIVENANGDQFSAKTIYINPISDLAIVKITDDNFKISGGLPFNIKKSNADLGDQVYMLGFPKQEIVYGEGYISAKNGYQMDTIYCQLNSSMNEGSSGSPVVNAAGDLVGIISSKETNAAGVVFATKSINIYRAIDEAKKLDKNNNIKPLSNQSLRGQSRVDQIKKLSNYVFMIKGN